MCAFGTLRFGTERLYAQKEDLLHEVLELEAEKGLLANSEGTKYQVGVSVYSIDEKVVLYVNTSTRNLFLKRVICFIGVDPLHSLLQFPPCSQFVSSGSLD